MGIINAYFPIEQMCIRDRVLLVLFREDMSEIRTVQFRFLSDTVDAQHDLCLLYTSIFFIANNQLLILLFII